MIDVVTWFGLPGYNVMGKMAINEFPGFFRRNQWAFMGLRLSNVLGRSILF